MKNLNHGCYGIVRAPCYWEVQQEEYYILAFSYNIFFKSRKLLDIVNGDEKLKNNTINNEV